MKTEKTIADLTVSVAICPPGLRTYWVCAGLNPDDSFYEISYPVVALQTRVFHRYVKTGSAYYIAPATHTEFLEENWEYCGEQVSTHFLVYDYDYELIETGDELMTDNARKERKEALFCPWPYDQTKDNEAISKLTAELKARLQKKVLDKAPKHDKPQASS